MTDNSTLALNDQRISKVLRDQAVASWMIFELPKGQLLLNLPQCVKIPPQLWRECMKLQRSAMNKLFCKVGKLLCWQSTVEGWVKVCPSMMILHVELCVLGSHFPTWLKNAWHRNELVMIFWLARGLGNVSGDAWYESKALHAVAQALGRCIRHPRDFGALVLLDSRWSELGSLSIHEFGWLVLSFFNGSWVGYSHTDKNIGDGSILVDSQDDFTTTFVVTLMP